MLGHQICHRTLVSLVKINARASNLPSNTCLTGQNQCQGIKSAIEHLSHWSKSMPGHQISHRTLDPLAKIILSPQISHRTLVSLVKINARTSNLPLNTCLTGQNQCQGIKSPIEHLIHWPKSFSHLKSPIEHLSHWSKSMLGHQISH